MDTLIAASTDWNTYFFPNVFALLNNHPLSIYNPPWALFPLIPFALVPFGRILMMAVAFVALAFTSIKSGARPVGVASLLVNPITYNCLVFGNVEWLALLGSSVRPDLGLLFLAIKPQMTAGLMFYYLVNCWKQAGWRSVARLVAPLAVLALISFIAFGLWPLRMASYVQYGNTTYDASIFPWGLPVGILLLWIAFRRKSPLYALAASPFFFPVVTPQVWLVLFLALVPSNYKSFLSSVLAWGVVILSYV